jgi:hypothetical protein
MERGKYAFFKRVEKKDPIMELVFSLQIDKLCLMIIAMMFFNVGSKML